MTVRAERRAMIAVIATFALLVQALIPSLAIAASPNKGDMLICTAMGLQSAPSDGGGAPPAKEHACEHCLCPAPVTAATPVVTVLRVSYVADAATAPAARTLRLPQARAPPRPPGQGPPNTNA